MSNGPRPGVPSGAPASRRTTKREVLGELGKLLDVSVSGAPWSEIVAALDQLNVVQLRGLLERIERVSAE